MATQNHAARLGMWLFLGTEVLLFAGLFLAYASTGSSTRRRSRRRVAQLDLVLGTVNTVVLISCRFTVALAYTR